MVDGTGIQPMLDSPLVNPNGVDWAASDRRIAVVRVVGDNRVMSIHFDPPRPRFVDLATGVTPTADARVGQIGGWQRLARTP